MRFVISGSDKRLQLLEKIMREEGMDVQTARSRADFSQADALVSKYPFDDMTGEGVFDLRKGAHLFLLNAKEVEKELKENFIVHSLMDETNFAEENAYITAEGAVYCAMRDAPFTLAGADIAVVGFGKIGRCLTELLVSVGAQVTVFSRRESGRLSAMARGANGASVEKMRALLADFQVIFVTSPTRMLSEREMHYISKSAFVYDLSGPPYGVDVEAAEEMGVCAKRESALPGRYAPKSVAKILFKTIQNLLGGEKV